MKHEMNAHVSLSGEQHSGCVLEAAASATIEKLHNIGSLCYRKPQVCVFA